MGAAEGACPRSVSMSQRWFCVGHLFEGYVLFSQGCVMLDEKIEFCPMLFKRRCPLGVGTWDLHT